MYTDQPEFDGRTGMPEEISPMQLQSLSPSVLVNGHGWCNMNRPTVCSESALCPSFLKPLCSVVAIVTVVLVVNVALIRWPRSRQQRTTGTAQVLVAFVHLLCTYSTVVLQFFTVNSITADTLWTRTGHVYQCLSEGSTVKETRL